MNGLPARAPLTDAARESPALSKASGGKTFKVVATVMTAASGLATLPHAGHVTFRGLHARRETGRRPGGGRARPEPIGAGDRLFYLAAWCGLAAGLTAAAFAVTTGSGMLSAASVLLTGLSSLVPDVIAWRRSARGGAASDRRASPVIRPETRPGPGIGREPTRELTPPRYSVRIEPAGRTLH